MLASLEEFELGVGPAVWGFVYVGGMRDEERMEGMR